MNTAQLIGLVLTSAVVSAVVVAVINLVGNRLDARDRAELGRFELEHESRMAELADARARRDRRAARIYDNLRVLARMLLAISDRTDQLLFFSREIHRPIEGLSVAVEQLRAARELLILDEATIDLLQDVLTVVREHDSFLISVQTWKDAVDIAKEGGPRTDSLPELRQQMNEAGETLTRPAPRPQGHPCPDGCQRKPAAAGRHA